MDAAKAPSTAMCVSFNHYATETSPKRLSSVVVKADAHCSAGRHRRIREGSNPASDYKNILITQKYYIQNKLYESLLCICCIMPADIVWGQNPERKVTLNILGTSWQPVSI